MEQLTEREQEVLDFIAKYRDDHGYSPSMREIGKGCYIGSLNGVSYFINRLVEKQAIEYVPKQARSITIRFEEVV